MLQQQQSLTTPMEGLSSSSSPSPSSPSSNQEVVVTCSGEEGIHMWDLHSGQLLMAYRNNSSSKSAVWDAIGSSHMIAVQQKRSAIHIWSWSKESPIHRFTPPERLEAIAVSNDGLYCVGGGVSGKLYLWQISTGRMLNSWDGHYKAVTVLKWTDNDTFLLSAGEDALLNLWSLSIIFGGVEDNKVRPEMAWNDHSLPITAIYCGSGGINGRVVTASKDQTCKVWDISTKKLVASLKFPASLTAVVMDAMERFLIVGAIDGRIFFVDMSVSAQDSPFSPLAHRHVGTSAKGLFDQSSQQDYQNNVLLGHDQSISSLSVSREGNILVSGSLDGVCKVWDLHSAQVIKSYNRLKGPVTHVVVMPRPQSLYLVDEVGGAGEKESGGGVVGGSITATTPSNTTTPAPTTGASKARVPLVKPFKNFLSRTQSVYNYEPPTLTEPQQIQQQTQQQSQQKNKKKGKQQAKSASEKNEERRMEELLVGGSVPLQLKSLAGHQSIRHYSSTENGGEALGRSLLMGGDSLSNHFMNDEFVLHHIDKHMRDLAGGTGVEAATIRENFRLQGEVAELREECEKWKKVNNELYQFCVHQLVEDSVLDTTIKSGSANTPKKRKTK